MNETATTGFTGWLRKPPVKRWEAVVHAATVAEADRQIYAATVGLRLVDVLVLPAGRDPNRPRRTP